MKRIISFVLLGLLWGNAQPSSAQESVENELELIRQLRAKGWNDLAKTKIDELLQRNDPVLNATLPLESARIDIAFARQQGPAQRFALFTAARTKLVDFIQKNQGKVQAALASVELARLTSYHAQALLTNAMREEDNESRHEKARPAETMFIQAAKDLEAAAKSLEAALGDANNAKFKNLLQAELHQTRFDLATNLFNQAKTYIDKGRNEVNEQRSLMIEKAKTAFTALRSDESTEIGWLANAWLMKCAIENTDPDNSEKFFNFVYKRRDDKAAQHALRLVQYFFLQDVAPPRPDEVEMIGSNPKYAKLKMIDRAKLVVKDGELWLKAYAPHIKSYEGQGVLYEVALAYLSEARAEKDQKPGGAKDKLLKKAETYLEKLAEMDGDLSEKARQISMSIKFQRVGTATVLKSFDDFYMKAMIERDRVRECNDKLDKAKDADDQKKIEGDRKKHLKEVIVCLNTAMSLATTQTPVTKVDDARYFLSGAYLANNDPYRAAIMSESLARTRPPTRRSPEGAATAIATYSSLQARNPQDASVRGRLQDLADYVLSPELQTSWKGDPVTSLANYHLAMAAKRENNPKKAIAHLEKLAPDFTDYLYTQGQIVFIAQDAREKNPDNKKESAFYTKAVYDALGRMPSVSAKESASVITMFFFAKMELAKLMYADAIADLNAKEELKAVKKCTDMAQYVKGLLGQFEQIPGGKITKENHDQIQFSMFVMLKYADLGVAEVKFRSDSKERFDQVIKATDNVVNEMLAKAKLVAAPEPIKLKDFRVTGDILSLALRANVQKGDVVKGKAILDVLKRLSGPDGPGTSGSVVALLMSDIADQIKRMKTAKDSDSKVALKAARGNYTAFLDEIAKEYEGKGWDSTAASMIGQAFVSLDYPSKAAQAFSKVKAPPDLDKKVDKKPPVNETDAQAKERQKWEQDIRQYWGAQIEYVRALRGCKEKDSLKTAEKLLTTLLGHPNARYQIQAMMERNLILEDQQRYGAAYLEWQKKFLTNKGLQDLSNKDVREIFFKGYFYSIRCLYKAAILDPGIKDRKKLVEAAGKMAIKIEFAPTKEGWEILGPLFQELIQAEDPLKIEYDRLKEERLKLEKGKK